MRKTRDTKNASLTYRFPPWICLTLITGCCPRQRLSGLVRGILVYQRCHHPHTQSEDGGALPVRSRVCSGNFTALCLWEKSLLIRTKDHGRSISKVLFSMFPSLSAKTISLATPQLLPRVSVCVCALGLMFLLQREVLNRILLKIRLKV